MLLQASLTCSDSQSVLSALPRQVAFQYFSEISNSALLFRRVLSDTDKKSAVFTQEKPIERSPSICSKVCRKQDDRVSLYTSFFYPRDSILSVLKHGLSTEVEAESL